jgi:cyclohexanone monooxygenase
MAVPDYDAIIIGAGFAGVYQLYTLGKLGLKVLLVEKAEDVGGTWLYNRYPGAGSDVHSFVYLFSFDSEDLKSYPWKNWYLIQPEVLAYISHVVNKHDLRKYIQFNTEFLGGSWDEEQNLWEVETSRQTNYNTLSDHRNQGFGGAECAGYQEFPRL